MSAVRPVVRDDLSAESPGSTEIRSRPASRKAGRWTGRLFLSMYRFWVRARDKTFSTLAGGAFASFGLGYALSRQKHT